MEHNSKFNSKHKDKLSRGNGLLILMFSLATVAKDAMTSSKMAATMATGNSSSLPSSPPLPVILASFPISGAPQSSRGVSKKKNLFLVNSLNYAIMSP